MVHVSRCIKKSGFLSSRTFSKLIQGLDISCKVLNDLALIQQNVVAVSSPTFKSGLKAGIEAKLTDPSLMLFTGRGVLNSGLETSGMRTSNLFSVVCT